MSPGEAFCGHPLPDREVIGGNNPPPPTPYEAARDRVDDLWGEAVLWLDGTPPGDQETADGLANLLTMIRAAAKEADAARKTEAEPFDAGKAEVQARYKPILSKAEQAEKTIKAALAPWLAKKDAEVREKAAAARAEADRKTAAAQAAIRAARESNLGERAAAEALLKDAKRADTVANKAGRETATAGGFGGRAVGLRTTWKPEIVNEIEALRWAWKTYPENMLCTVMILAEKEIRAGRHEIPGFSITKTTTAV